MSFLYEGIDLVKKYGAETVLDIARFTLEEGQNLVLEGPNGSGKSTFLRILAYLESPTSGALLYGGSRPPRQECTLLLQEPFLLHETVFTNVILGLKLRGIKTNLDKEYASAMQAAGFADPQAFARRKPGALSGGEKQRVALASRLILKPRVLLLDEPTAHVDAQSAAHILEALRQVAGTTIICATHDALLARNLGASRMLLSKPG